MKDNLEKIIDTAKLASLRPEEKAMIRASLLHKINTTKVASPFWAFAFVKSHHYVPAFMLLFVFLSGGTSYFAQSSLPGDALYSMKINVNENLESFVAFTDKQVAEVVAVQATRRLDEAELLAVKGVLKVEQNEEIKNSFSKKVVALNNTFAKMEEKGEAESAREVLTRFNDKVKSKIDVLSNISDDKGEVSIASDIAMFITERHEGQKRVKSKSSDNARAMTFSATVASNVETGDTSVDSEKNDDTNNDDVDEPVAVTMMMAMEAPDAPVATTTATSTESQATSTDDTKDSESDDSDEVDIKTIFKPTIRWEWRHDD